MSDHNDHSTARRIGEELEQGSFRGFMPESDRLMGALQTYAASERQHYAAGVPENLRETLWQQIVAVTQAPQTTHARNSATPATPQNMASGHAPTATTPASVRPATPASPKTVTPQPLHLLRSPWIWAAAAAVLLALFAGLWQSGILGGSGATISSAERVLLATSAETNTTYTFADGSVATLRPHSALYALASDRGTELHLDGEAFFAVSPQAEGHTFAVRSGETRVQVVGTRFNVRGWAAQTEVYVDEGRVRLTATAPSDAPQSLELTAGQLGFSTPEGLLRRTNATSDEIIGWLNAEIIFRERSLASIASELGQHFGIRLEVAPSAAGITLSGRIFLDNADQTLRELSLVSDLQLEKSSENHYVLTLP